jgi:heme-degrading monooxygenase HmoA
MDDCGWSGCSDTRASTGPAWGSQFQLMIARTWHGRALPANAGKYAQHATARVLPALNTIAGYRGGMVLRRDAGAEVEFVVVTLWDSMKAVREFAGDTPERAVVEPAAREVLSGFDELVSHYEVVTDSR